MKNAIWLMALVTLLSAGCGKKSHDPQETGGRAKEAAAGQPAKAADGDAHEKHGDHDEEGERHEGEGHEGAAAEVVELAPEALRTAQIQTVEATSRALSTILTAPARIRFSQTGVARVAPRVPGILDQISVKLGQTVKKGAVLGWIESPELGRARADYLAAATRARAAEDNHRRERDLLAKGITSVTVHAQKPMRSIPCAEGIDRAWRM